MTRASWLQKIYWTHFSKPTAERALFRHLISNQVGSILEIGVGDGSRMKRIAKLSRFFAGSEPLRYIGVDEFESASSGRHLTLKQAHRLAGQLGFKVSLIPGEVSNAIPRVAHKLGSSDLVIIDGGLDPQEPLVGMIGSWLNRLAHRDSTIIACQTPGDRLIVIESQRLELPIRIAA